MQNRMPPWFFLCIFVIVAAGAIVFHPSLDIGFWTDDYSFIDAAGRLDFADYLTSYFDPRLQWHWYRPMQGLQWWIGYQVFRGDARGYHLMQLGLHLANACLLFDLTRLITRRWRLALLAALVYVTLGVGSLAVIWVGVADPLVGVFYLLTIRFWFNYLTTAKSHWFALTFATFVGALMSKEIAATLPITLFLVDRWLVAKPASLIELIKHYAVFALVLAIYGLVELNVLTRGVFTTYLGYGVGSHVLVMLAQHSTTLAFPWGLPSPLNSVWLAIVLALIAFAALRGERRVLFLSAATLLALMPILPFQPNMASAPRYLYLPLMGSAIGTALFLESARRWLADSHRRRVSLIAAAIGACTVVWNGAAIAESALSFGGMARQTRIQFRPIFQSYPSFPQDTLLYFLNPPMESPYISGLVFLRYGRGVVASGNDLSHRVALASHNAAWIFYQDDENKWRGLPVAKNVSARAGTDLPTQFAGMITFDGFEIANDQVKRGQSIGLILYWRAAGKIEKDYTLFAHLINAQGEMLAGTDSPPRQGAFPTRAWRVNELVVDGMIIPIEPNVPPGEYRLEIGIYDLATMQRLAVINADGQPISDNVVIAPIWIFE